MRLKVSVMLAALVAALAVPAAAQPVGCASGSTGGNWPSYGGSLSNMRNQTAENTIGTANVGSLTPKWIYSISTAIPGGGAFSNTPIVADGCIYLASNTGWVVALNADTSQPVWQYKFNGAGQTLLGGIIVGSPVVADGKVFVGVSRPSTPYVAALDQATGALLWQTTIETGQQNSLINASPVYVNGMIFQGFAGNEGGSVARGGFVFLDAATGAIKAHTYTITQAEYDAGYRGASVWCTAAYDPATKFVYACGGNPASKKIEARNSNALLKIDADPTRLATFGEITNAYKGETDQYYPGLDRQPVCENADNPVPQAPWSATCAQLDLDFGSSPNLFSDNLGRPIIGALQKSGIYHAVYADTMQRAWTTVIGAPCAACNASSSAFDATSIYAVATPGGHMTSIARDGGRHQWAFPIGGGTHFQSVTTANGVVYTMDNAGMLNAFDASNGLLLARRPMTQDAGVVVSDAGSAGIAVARNTIYAATSDHVIAYH